MLTDTQIKKHKESGRRIADGRGLFLYCYQHTDGAFSKRWQIRHEEKDLESGKTKTHWLNLEGIDGDPEGAYEARSLALDYKAKKRQGVDIVAYHNRRTNKQVEEVRRDTTGARTFAEVASELFRIDVRRERWTNDKAQAQWINTQHDWVFPVIGLKPIDEITVADIVEVLTQDAEETQRSAGGPFWKARAVTAPKVRTRIEEVIDHAIDEGYVDENFINPAKMTRRLAKKLPVVNHVVKNHKALPIADCPSFAQMLRQASPSATTFALEFAMLTGLRLGTICQAEWDQFDFEKEVWKCPAPIMKGRLDHFTPISKRMLEILDLISADGDRSGYVFKADEKFVSRGVNKHIAPNGITQAIHKRGYEATSHGFRTVIRNFATANGFSTETAKIHLGQLVGGKVDQAYTRQWELDGARLPDRRRLMDEWELYLDGKRSLTMGEAPAFMEAAQ